MKAGSDNDDALDGTLYVDSSLDEGIVLCMVWVLITVGLSIFFGITLLNWQVDHGYPRFAAGGTPPNNFESNLYQVQWVFIMLVNINLLPPILLAWAIMSLSRVPAADLHYFTSVFAILVSFVVFLAMAWWWCAFCNGTNGALSLCKDPRWCCLEANRVAAPDYCSITVPCVPGVDTKGELSANTQWQTVFWLCLGWVFVNIVHLALNSRMRYWGAWSPRRYFKY